jgi:uncharacterized Zn-binding protein involved in type VI secretion
MAKAGRLGDRSRVPEDSHGCPSCPHDATGPSTTASDDVFINNRPALRVGDRGVHSSCCGPETWEAAEGAPAVDINDRAAHRKGDACEHCGGRGALIEGSDDVLIGDAVEGGDAPAEAPRGPAAIWV